MEWKKKAEIISFSGILHTLDGFSQLALGHIHLQFMSFVTARDRDFKVVYL